MADSLMPRAVASIFVPRVQRDCRMTCSRGQRVAAVRLTRASNEAPSKLHLKIVSKSIVFDFSLNLIFKESNLRTYYPSSGAPW